MPQPPLRRLLVVPAPERRKDAGGVPFRNTCSLGSILGENHHSPEGKLVPTPYNEHGCYTHCLKSRSCPGAWGCCRSWPTWLRSALQHMSPVKAFRVLARSICNQGLKFPPKCPSGPSVQRKASEKASAVGRVRKVDLKKAHKIHSTSSFSKL